MEGSNSTRTVSPKIRKIHAIAVSVFGSKADVGRAT